MDLHVFPILILRPTSLSTRSLWVFAVHQALTLHLKQLEKEEMKNPRVSRRKEILKLEQK